MPRLCLVPELRAGTLCPAELHSNALSLMQQALRMQPPSNASHGQHRAVGAALLWVSMALNQMPKPEGMKVTRLPIISSCICLAMVVCTCALCCRLSCHQPNLQPQESYVQPKQPASPRPEQKPGHAASGLHHSHRYRYRGIPSLEASVCMNSVVAMLFTSSTPRWAWSLQLSAFRAPGCLQEGMDRATMA